MRVPSTLKRRAFFVLAKAGIPLGEMLGASENLACDGNFTPLLILFPKIAFLWNLCPIKMIDLVKVLWYIIQRRFYELQRHVYG